MVEPLTLSALGVVALTEGIKFFYSQAGEILKRWRDLREKRSEGESLTQLNLEKVQLPQVFEEQLSDVKIHFDVVEQLENQLRDLRKELSDYADEIETVEVDNENLLQKVDVLRQLLEAIFQQNITFKGERRPSSELVVEGRIDIQRIVGYAAAIRAKKITRGQVTAGVKAIAVESGGQVVGLEVDEIG